MITAYKGINELDFLLDAIHKEMSCFVHFDEKNAASFDFLRSKYPDVKFYSEFCINWGENEHLSAVLPLKSALADFNWDYVHIISGEDYPIISAKNMADRLAESSEIFIKASDVTAKKHFAHKWYAYRWPYSFFSQNYKDQRIRYFNLACVAIQIFIPFLKRKRIGKLTQVYHVMIWGMLPRDAVEYVISYLSDNPEFLQDLKSCKVPEELCIATVLMNVPKFKSRIHGRNLRYWQMKPGDWGLSYLSECSIRDLATTDAFWARKVMSGILVSKYLKSKISIRV